MNYQLSISRRLCFRVHLCLSVGKIHLILKNILIILWCFKNSSYLCIVSVSPVRGAAGRDWNKTFTERYLRLSNLANSTSQRRYRQRERLRWVYYTLVCYIYVRAYIYINVRSLYNISRRGLTAVAYPLREAMLEPDGGISKQGRDSHVFRVQSRALF